MPVCGRYTVSVAIGELMAMYEAEEPERYYPTPRMPVILRRDDARKWLDHTRDIERVLGQCQSSIRMPTGANG